ncbi:MAG: hypothetical protein COA50_10780 [Flavobacteriaceae bacterium]|nr:MAG: hypothetical protein COA50_10780 [Flavobacteriaceae bacterium]
MLHLKNIEYWACGLGVGLGGLISLVLIYSSQLDIFIIEREPILVRMSVPVETSKEKRVLLAAEIMESLYNFNQIKEVKSYIGRADGDVGDLVSLYSSELLFALVLHDQWQSKSKKKVLIKELNKSAFNYPGVVLMVLPDKFFPAVLSGNNSNTTQMKFVPNSGVLLELGISKAELNKELEAYVYYGYDGLTIQDLETFNFISSNGKVIPFSALGKYEIIQVQRNLKNLAPGHWEEKINSDDIKKNEVIRIELDVFKLQAYGQQLSSVVNIINDELEFLEKDTDIESIGGVIVLETKEHKILLRDVASIDKGYLDGAQININGLQYMIRLYHK